MPAARAAGRRRDMTDKKQEENLGTAKYVRPEATRVQIIGVSAQCNPSGSGDSDSCSNGAGAVTTCAATGNGAQNSCAPGLGFVP